MSALLFCMGRLIGLDILSISSFLGGIFDLAVVGLIWQAIARVP
ncbi:hypothetical protein [Desmonostoc muscorum]|nr:hypothetical protein [Desmonostoc muscorum]